jgi:hypothetical protein
MALITESRLPDAARSVGDDGNPGRDSDGGRGPIFGFLNRELFGSDRKIPGDYTFAGIYVSHSLSA